MYRATTLCSLLIITIINTGCCPKQPPIHQKCIVPDADEPIIDRAKCDDRDYGCIIAKALSNYESMKAYAETLKINSETCK